MRPGVLSALLALAACSDRHPPPPAPASSAAPDPEPASSARRPTRRYYLARTAARCEIFFADPGHVSPPEPTPCPQFLEVGERVRLAGKACFREGGDPDRVEPCVCPVPLMDFERRDRSKSPPP
jgi:hypothetical protein